MMSLSRHTSDKMRGDSVSLLAPVWESILSFKYFLFHPTQPSPFTSLSVKEDLQRLQLENQLLETEFAYLQKQLNEQLLFSSQFAQIASSSPEEAHALSTDYQKSLQRTLQTMKWRLKALPARVIFRSFDTWNSSLWINVGKSANEAYHTPLVALNSPIVIGRMIVGVIDYVGEHQSRVRLITDHRLTPSVRASRGGEQDFLISEQIAGLLQQMDRKKQLPLSPDDQAHLFELLKELKQGLRPLKKTWYLAKGELLGSSSPSRVGQNVSLKGTGFNYDFADEEGDSRDLRNGKSLQHPQEQPITILKINDILVTTGMDGIFPPGFQVAIVTHVKLLKEGDYFYEIEAQPLAGPLEELTLVFVLPPLHEEKIQE
jgi:cell shape-determining protein MreC